MQYGNRSEHGSIQEADLELKKPLVAADRRESEMQALQKFSLISDRDVIGDLFDNGIRAASLEIISAIPLVEVAWADGFVERSEKLAVMAIAEELGIRRSSVAYIMLAEWLSEHPGRTLFLTWRRYVTALRHVVGQRAFNELRSVTLRGARRVADSAGGYLGFAATSAAERAVITQLEEAFHNETVRCTESLKQNLTIEVGLLQALVDQMVSQGVIPANAYSIARQRMETVWQIDWSLIEFSEQNGVVSSTERSRTS